MIINTIVRNKWFFVPYLLVLVLSSIILVVFSKAGIHIYCNRYYSGFADLFFKYITNLGDGMFLPLFIVITLFYSFRYSILQLIVFLISGLLVQVFKRVTFLDSYRPAKYLENIYNLHLVNGIHQYSFHSFPSGHAATAFGIFLCFTFISDKNRTKLLMFLCALIIAYSRVYLSQHFLVDIVAGSLIGVVVALFSYVWINTLQYSWMDKKIRIFKSIPVI